MKFHELEVRNVRGIRHLVLQPHGDNLVICGPNGSGKSGVVDAIDYLLTGRITRLSGVGAGVLSLSKHGPHVDTGAESAEVRAIVSLPPDERQFEISRGMADGGLRVLPPDMAEPLVPVLRTASAGQYVLARREILTLVTATASDRARVIQTLLHLDELEVTRKALGAAANEATATIKGSRQSLERAQDAFAAVAELRGWDEQEALDAVNRLRAQLGGGDLATLLPATLKDGLHPVTVANTDRELLRVASAAQQMTSTWQGLAEGIRTDSKHVAEGAEALYWDAHNLTALRRHRLLHLGLELVPEEGACPLCGAQWTPGELSVRIEQELTLAAEVEGARVDLAGLAADLHARVSLARGALAQLTSAVSQHGGLDHEAGLTTWLDACTAYEEALACSLEKPGSCLGLILHRPAFLDDDVARVSEELRAHSAAAIPAITHEQRAWDILTRLVDHLTEVQQQEKQLAADSVRETRAAALRDSFVSARDAVLNELYEEVKGRFEVLYRQLHEDDEGHFNARLSHDGASLDLEVDFFGRGLYPPHALHSEGHQDSMGLCLYLALAEHVNRGVVGITVLDDVVMSVDAGHRKRLCRVLATEFPDMQFLITTHDRSWAQQLRTEGVVQAGGVVRFLGWTVDAGPRTDNRDLWQQIEEQLERDEPSGAAAGLRRGMEEFFGTLCENLQAMVPYRAGGQYTLGDLFAAGCGQYNKLMREAKAVAQAWGDQDLGLRLEEAESTARQCLLRTQAEQWGLNPAVHYDAWHQLEASDLRDIVDAFKDLHDVFRCSLCNGMLYLSTVGLERQALRCACQGVNWNLVRKARTA